MDLNWHPGPRPATIPAMRFKSFAILTLLCVATLSAPAADPKQPAKQLNALLITGGCCHNYIFQSQALTEGVSKTVNVKWSVVNEGGTGTRGMIKLYDDPDWSKKYDIVVHNECFANTSDPKYVRKITKAHHAGTPAVVIHCAMHTYRAAEFDDWRQFLGVTSKRHDHQSNYAVKNVAPKHPIMKGFPENWVTPKDELYVIEKLWPKAKSLATSVSEKDGKAHPVFWTNLYGKARIFGTTYGHSDETFKDPVFINTIARGMLWATGNLENKKVK